MKQRRAAQPVELLEETIGGEEELPPPARRVGEDLEPVAGVIVMAVL